MVEEKKVIYNVEVKADSNSLKKLDKASQDTSKSVKKVGTSADETSTKLKENTKSTNILKDGYAKLVIGITAGIAAISGIIKGVKESIKLYDIQAKSEKLLEVALGKTSKAILDQASALQKRTIYGDEAIIGGQALLAQMDLSEQQILKLTPKVLDLAAAQGLDLNAAFKLVAESVGTSGNKLKKYGIEVEGAIGSDERLDGVITELSKKFNGQAEATTVGAGRLTQWSNVVGDAKEKVGEFAIGIINTLFPLKQQSDLIVDEEIGFNKLYGTILKTTEGTKERAKAVQALNDKYPDYIANIDLNKSGDSELRKELRLTNIEYKNRYIIQLSTEKVDKAREKLGKAEYKLRSRESDLEDLLYEKAKKQGIQNDEVFTNATIRGKARLLNLSKTNQKYDKWDAAILKVSYAKTNLNKIQTEENKIVGDLIETVEELTETITKSEEDKIKLYNKTFNTKLALDTELSQNQETRLNEELLRLKNLNKNKNKERKKTNTEIVKDMQDVEDFNEDILDEEFDAFLKFLDKEEDAADKARANSLKSKVDNLTKSAKFEKDLIDGTVDNNEEAVKQKLDVDIKYAKDVLDLYIQQARADKILTEEEEKILILKQKHMNNL